MYQSIHNSLKRRSISKSVWRLFLCCQRSQLPQVLELRPQCTSPLNPVHDATERRPPAPVQHLSVAGPRATSPPPAPAFGTVQHGRWAAARRHPCSIHWRLIERTAAKNHRPPCVLHTSMSPLSMGPPTNVAIHASFAAERRIEQAARRNHGIIHLPMLPPSDVS